MTIVRRLIAMLSGLMMIAPLPAMAAETQPIARHVEARALETAESAHVPGWVFVVVDGDGIVASASGGLADVDARRQMTLDTPLRVGSISKPVTAALAAELAAESTIDLDIPVDTYLSTSLSDRFGPASTIRQLLQHRGGYPDAFLGSHHVDRSDAVSLSDWVRTIPARSMAPGVVASYSSVGYTLVGAAIEGAMGVPFAEAAETDLFGPLGMTDATFVQPPSSQVAVGYRWNGDGFEPYPIDVPDFVAGAGLTASARDIASFMRGLLDPDGPLDRQTRRLLTTRQGPEPGLRGFTMGLTEWNYETQTVLYHEGNGIGTTNRMVLLPDRGVGIFTAVNGEALVGLGDPSPQTLFARDLQESVISLFFPGPGDVEQAGWTDGAAPATTIDGTYAPTRIDPDSLLRLETLFSQFEVSQHGDVVRFGSSELRRVSDAADGGPAGDVAFVEDSDGSVFAARGGTGSYRRLDAWETLPFNLLWLAASLLLIVVGMVAGVRKTSGLVRGSIVAAGTFALAFLGLLAGGLLTAEVMALFTGLTLPIAAARFAGAALVVAIGALLAAVVRGGVGDSKAARMSVATVALGAGSIVFWAVTWSVLPI